MTAGGCAWRPRLCAFAAALAVLAAARLAEPDATRRATLLYAIVVALGYPHLVGAALFGRGAARGGWLRTGCAACGVALAFALYASWPGPLLPLLLALSMWHVVENERALVLSARGSGLPPPARDLDEHALLGGATALLLALFAGSGVPTALAPAGDAGALAGSGATTLRGLGAAAGLLLAARGRRPGAGVALCATAAVLPTAPAPLAFADLFALASLHHLLGWLARAARRGRGAALLGLHAAWMALCAALLAAGAAAAPLREAVFSPALYLFASALHVVQTAYARARQA